MNAKGRPPKRARYCFRGSSVGSFATFAANLASFVHRQNLGDVGLRFRLAGIDVSERVASTTLLEAADANSTPIILGIIISLACLLFLALSPTAWSALLDASRHFKRGTARSRHHCEPAGYLLGGPGRREAAERLREILAE